MGVIDAGRALALAGVPFRPQGRDERGLDCVGLCLAAFGLPPTLVRDDYRQRGDHREEAERILRQAFRKIGRGKAAPGDLLLMQAGPEQLHLAILTEGGFIHADAKLRRVAEVPGDPPWPVIGTYRRRVRQRVGE